MTVRGALVSVATCVLAATVACSAAGSGNGNGNAWGTQPLLKGLNPGATSAGAPVTLTVYGSNFNGKCVVLWNGTKRPTTVVNSSQAQASLYSSDVSSPSTAQVSVLNTNSGNQSNSVTFIVAQPGPLFVATTSLPPGTVGTAYSTTVSASGGAAPYTWSLAAGQLPSGVALGTSGAISGTPTTAGQYSFQVQVADSSSPQQTSLQTLAISVASATTTTTALQITTTSLPSGQVGTSYGATLAATGGVSPYTWSVASGALATGVTLASTTGALSGTPTTAGTFAVTLGVTDATGASTTANFAITIVAALALQITTTALPNGFIGSPYSAAVSVTGGTAPYTWSITSGSLPSSVALGASTGSISGTPSTPGTFTPTVQVTDSAQKVVSSSYSFAISSSALDQYGGRTDISCTTNAGKWHTEKIGTQWWICTPSQGAFFKQSLYVTGIAPNLNVTSKYGTTTAFYNAQLSRFAAWGFNTIDLVADTNLWPINSHPTLLPFINGGKPGLASVNGAGLYNGITYANKNLWGAMPAGAYQYSPWLPTQPDPSDPGIATVAAYGFLHNDPWPSIAASGNVKYLMGVSLDDADNMWGFANDGCTGNPTEHMGWVALASSPIQNAGVLNVYSSSGQQFLYYDNRLVSKTNLETFLQGRYGTIGALNTAWGSSYTQWDTTGTVVTAETVSVGNGGTTYSHTLATATPSRYSSAITIGGTVVAGELSHDSGSGNADPTNTTDGRMWGPYVTGTLTYNTKALSLTFSTTANAEAGDRNIQQISLTSNVVTVVTHQQHGLWTGAKVNIAGTTNYNGTAIGPITVVDSITFTYAKTATLATEYTGTYALNALPSSSDTIKVNYVANGWGSGTGLMDEANNHSWSSGDPYSCNLNALVSTTMRTDLNDYLYQIANTYYSGLKGTVNSAFPYAMYVGHDAFPGVPKAPILKAAGANLDVATTNYGNQLTQAQLDSFYASYGDRPIFDNLYATTQMDSAYATVVDTITPHYLTQEAKGSGYYNRIQSALNATYSANGSHPYVGLGVWSYLDMNDGNPYRWGLVTINDNAYDGHEAAPGSKTCSAPLDGSVVGPYTCVAEAAYTTPSWASGTYYAGADSNVKRHVVGLVGSTYYIFENGNGGTSGSTQPNWTTTCPALGNTCTDGGLTWTNMGVWTKAASPSTYGDAITNVKKGNALWLKLIP